MAKVVKFPGPAPEKFGLQRARKRKGDLPGKAGQLNLFGGRVIKLNHLSTFEEALMLDEAGNYEQASVLYQKAIGEGDFVADAWCNLGIIESQKENHARAIDAFTKCLVNDPRHYEAHYNLANLYAEVGNYALAKVHYAIASEIEPTFPNSYFNLGITLAMNREYTEAIRVLKKYCSLTPAEDHGPAIELISQLSSLG
ncbi:MAG: tetratricopeptide repeat protein [Flammeovirgaceae bacterium]|nr:MAG: tetratricopeptide repeat protein [Flammeovirgaceae bacterium]